MMNRLILLAVCFVLILSVAAAQETPPQGTLVEIQAEDGLKLVGEYFAPHEGDFPAVLLLHQLYTTRRSWRGVIPSLLDQGYRVLAVDLRGYGASRGAINWRAAQDDTQAWLAWLRAQPGVQGNQVFIMGSSMGANLALVGCAQAEACAGAVALSPGWNYFGVYTEDAVLSGRHTLIVYADRDRQPGREVPQMIARAAEHNLSSVSALSYPGRAHGIDLFRVDADLLDTIIGWMNDH